MWIPFTPWWESLVTVCLVVFNITVQGYFCVLVSVNLGQLSDLYLSGENLRAHLIWRVTAGHSFQHYDELTNTSLATRVCSGWRAFSISYDQFQAVEAFEKYLDGEETNFATVILGGSGLCVLALVCWSALVMVDICSNVDLTRALLSCDAGSWHAASVVRQPFAITSLSRRHLCFLFLFTILPRLGVSVNLFIAGARFLCHTLEIGDLILNAVALGFIMELDEIVFQFLPTRVRCAVAKSDPLPMGRVCGSSFDASHPSAVVCVGAAMVAFWYGMMGDVITRMRLAEQFLCGGNTDFVYAVDPLTGIVNVGDTAGVPVLDLNSYQSHAVFQETHLDEDTMDDLQDYWGLDDSWVLWDEDLSLHTNVDGVDAVQKLVAEDSLAILTCEDLDQYSQYRSR